ncbi:UTRA domain-containing protein [Streptomyces sp. SDr-06]|uniref:UTRA domain-containing protein n=1 Tax=Streptomyces sp. SDr-06 TaxID=2267702 RepID=UPI000DE9C76B|nr:UTRA domain-containing protein [Streptomyces sp. SDr-06]RCH65481.1 UTRA domain-containing protein [Streptomyces sp. SDr-06]
MTGEWTSSESSSYVTPREPGHGDAWAEEAAQLGKAGTHRLTEVVECIPPEPIATALKLEPGELAVVRRRVVELDGKPIELADSYYPLGIAQGTALAEHRKIPGGAPTLLAGLGHVAAAVDEDISCREATAAERAALGLGHAEWVLLLARLTVDQTGLPVEAMLMTMKTQGRHLHYRMRTS